jgi:hypothetical protein
VRLALVTRGGFFVGPFEEASAKPRAIVPAVAATRRVIKKFRCRIGIS